MTRPSAALLVVALIALVALVACGDKESAQPRAKTVVFDAAVVRGPGVPTWTATLCDAPAGVVDWGGGPGWIGGQLAVASAACGEATLDSSTGVIVASEHTDSASIRKRALALGARLPGMDPDLVSATPVGGDSVVLVTRTSIARFPAVKSTTQPASTWEHSYDERAALGVAGPVLAGDTVVTVVDETLVGRRWDSGAENWRGEGRYSHGAGSLVRTGDTVRAIAIDEGVGPVTIDPHVGTRGTTGATVRGIDVLAAAWSNSGALVAVVRVDSSLRNDVVAGFRADGTHAWSWSLPARDRADYVGVLIDDKTSSAFVFYDGVSVSRFDLPK